MNKTLLAGLLGVSLSAAVATQAYAVGSLVDVSVYDRTEQRELPVYYAEGKYYVAGRPGNEYQISLRSRSGEDLLSVVSVDGVNAISGETASWQQSGYVLSPWRETEIKGWRKSVSRVARFYFTELPDSYAARTGRPDDVGVIGVAVFRRQHEPPVYQPYPDHSERERYEHYRGRAEGQSGAAPQKAPRAKAQGGGDSATRAVPESSASEYGPSYHGAPAPEPKVGTGHGRSERSKVRYVDFVRASSHPDEVISIHYDSHHNLVARGIIPRERYAQPRDADPFPGQFTPDPPRYQW